MWISGSTASLLVIVEPDMVKSTHGDTSHAHPGNSSPAAFNRPISAAVRPPPALSPPTAMWAAHQSRFGKLDRKERQMRIRLIGGSVAIALDARQHGERGKLLSVSGTGSGACSGGRHQRKQGTALCDGCLLYAL